MDISASSCNLETRDTVLYRPEACDDCGAIARMVVPATLFRISEPPWLLVEEGFTLAREHEIESLFAIGNGYIGNRGSLAEGSPLSAPATFLAGIFEHSDQPGSIPQLMTLPDWTEVRVWIDDHPLSMQEGEIIEHRRILDFARGVLWREWRHRDKNGRVTRLLAFRLTSLADRHLLLQSVIVVAENYSATMRFESSIEVPRSALPAPSRWKARRSPERPNVLPLALKCPGRDIEIAFGAASQLLTTTASVGERLVEMDERHIVERFQLKVTVGTECHLHRLVSVYSSRDLEDPFDAAVAHVNRVLPSRISEAVSAHETAWNSRWQHSDIRVEGDDSLQRALRFAVYHLISAANPEDSHVSIGARALTGEAYKGHVFWDTEIFMLPFYTYTDPACARALLTYRYHTLEAAREKARRAGFAGAMYPWESADTGEETTPRAVIAPSGEVISVLNGELEIHITADIAYAVWQYWQGTGDDDFFAQFGSEITLETARFWASRGRMEADGRYHLRQVIGPDEYHENVDDNTFTNLMAAWNLVRGAEAAGWLRAKRPDRWRELEHRLQLSDQELRMWSHLAEVMYTIFDPKTLLYEQFAGYYQKEAIDLKKFEPRTAAMDVILGHERINHTNVVKQADVVMALYLLWSQIPADVRRANFLYYEPRTGHGSSLSPSMHALVAARLGEAHLAGQYLKQAAQIDLGNNMGNAAGGVHAAAIGGLWQAVVFGLGGLEVDGSGLSFTPHLVESCRQLAFPFRWRERQLEVAITHHKLQVAVQGPGPLQLRVAGGAETLAQPGHTYVVERANRGWSSWHRLDS
ncbi:MAG: glycoside hydrolase family 65 protein [Acidobacteria bacterium]|nr:glycoside hydrolase family 65 protein [Acidobacteriota bacterium]